MQIEMNMYLFSLQTCIFMSKSRHEDAKPDSHYTRRRQTVRHVWVCVCVF